MSASPDTPAVLVVVDSVRMPGSHSLATHHTKVRVTVNNSPLCSYDSRDYPDGEKGARRDAEFQARLAVEALRIVGLPVKGTTHGYNL